MDLTNRVKTIYSADTAQAQAAVKHLRGVERDEAKKTLAALEQSNAKLSDQVAMFTKIGAAVGAAYGAWKLAGAAVEEHLKEMRLRAASAGASIERLESATRGLIEGGELMAFAGKAMHGVWKLNQAEMEIVLKGADALSRKMGVELKPTVESLTEAIAKGNTKAFKELGVEVKDKTDLLRVFGGAAAQAGDMGTTAAERWQQATVEWNNAVGELKNQMGSMVIEMAPLIKMFAELAGHLAGIAKHMGGIGSMGRRIVGMGGAADAGGDLRDVFEANQAGAATFADKFRTAEGKRAMEDALGEGADLLLQGAAWIARNRAANVAAAAKAKSGGSGSFSLDTQQVDGVEVDLFKGMGGSLGGPGAIDKVGPMTPAGNITLEEDMAKSKQFLEDLNNISAGVREQWAGQPTILEQIFGKPDDITALSVAVGVAAQAVDGLTNAIAASFEAAVTGSDSAVDAFKKVAAGAVHAIGQKLAVIGAEQLVLAAVDAAYGNFAGAALHTGAAGLAFAGSAVAFKVAQEMGHGASSAAAKGTGGGAALGGGIRAGSTGRGGGERGERTVVVALGRDFGVLSDIEQRQLLHQAIRMGLDGGPTSGGSSTSRIRHS